MMTFEFTTGHVMTMNHAIMTARASGLLQSRLRTLRRESSTAIRGVGRPGTARLSRRLGQGNFFNDLSMSAACMEDQV